MLGTQNRLGWPSVSSDIWRDMQTLAGEGRTNGHRVWRPAATVSEGEDRFSIRLEVPGVDAQAIDVDLDGVYLTVRGERPAPVEVEGSTVLLSEIAWGPFERRFRLGSEADREAIEATFRDGVLEIAVPKRQEARPRRIPVTTSA